LESHACSKLVAQYDQKSGLSLFWPHGGVPANVEWAAMVSPTASKI
jgi:hypothetical protein